MRGFRRRNRVGRLMLRITLPGDGPRQPEQQKSGKREYALSQSGHGFNLSRNSRFTL